MPPRAHRLTVALLSSVCVAFTAGCVTTKVPVSSPCLTTESLPVKPRPAFPAMLPESSPDELMQALLLDYAALWAFADSAWPLLVECAK